MGILVGQDFNYDFDVSFTEGQQRSVILRTITAKTDSAHARTRSPRASRCRKP